MSVDQEGFNLLGFIEYWQQQSTASKFLALLLSASLLVGTIFFSQAIVRPSMSLLYGNLDPKTSGEVLEELDSLGVNYVVKSRSVYVASSERDRLRLSLATKGIPSNSIEGYEILDSLNGFGTTSRMFDAAYWRAKEGELARTISSSPFIKSARVHLSSGGGRFERGTALEKASIFLSFRPSVRGNKGAVGVKHLVAAAVPGLSVENVSVIDADTGDVVGELNGFGSLGQHDHDISTMKKNVERILEAFVGAGNVRVGMSVERISVTEYIKEKTVDPESVVAISSDSLETTQSSSGQTGSNITVASNVPNGNANNSDQGVESSNSEVRQRSNFEVSEVNREIRKSPGDIKRITVAAVVNWLPDPLSEDETKTRPLTETEILDFKELIQSAVGFDEGRGDVVTVKSMKFAENVFVGSAPSSSGWLSQLDAIDIVKLVLLFALIVLLFIFLIRQSSSKLPLGSDFELSENGGAEPESSDEGLTQISLDNPLSPIDGSDHDFEEIEDFDFSGGAGISDDDPLTSLKSAFESRGAASSEILRSWLTETSNVREV